MNEQKKKKKIVRVNEKLHNMIKQSMSKQNHTHIIEIALEELIWLN